MSRASRMHSDDDSASDAHLIHSFLDACAKRLSALATEQPAAHGASAFARAIDRSSLLQFQACSLPALDTLRHVDDTPLGRRFVEVAPLLAWQPTFRTDDHGVDIGLAPLDKVCDLGELTVGIMYVRPGCAYPLHSHPPHELYLVLAGHGEWRYGGHVGFRSVTPGTVLYNHPGDLHSAVAGDEPLVALYVLWD